MALPALLWLSAASAVVVIAIHALSWKRPRPRPLPTLRFLPSAARVARFRRLEPSELVLLALRVLVLGLVGLAAAGAAGAWRSSALARVVVIDQSRAVDSSREVSDSVATLLRDGVTTRMVVFDSVARVLNGALAPGDSALRPRRGNLAAALVVAVREAVRLRSTADSVELVVVSPLVREETSGAIGNIVGAWGGPVRLVRVSAREAVTSGEAGGSLPSPDDPLGAAAWTVWGRSAPHLRLQRGAPSGPDSAFARGGGAVVMWPALAGTGLELGAVSTGAVAAIGHFRWSPDAVRGTPIAWREDGRVVAGEEGVGRGCLRTVGVDVPSQGDAALRPAFIAVVRELTRPCGDVDLRLADASVLTPLRDSAMASPNTNRHASAWLPRLLLFMALLALGVEGWLRDRRVRPALPASAGTALAEVA